MASTNNLEKSQKYLSVIMELFNRGSATARLDSLSQQLDFADAKTVKVLSVSTTGMGNYVKDVGYPQGAITTEWIPFELLQDRGVRFLLDRIDNDEVLGLSIGRAAQNFTDRQMIPELDAYRFAKYANGAGKKETGTFTGGGSLINAFDKAASDMNGLDVPEAGRILYVNQDLEIIVRRELARQWSNDSVINTRINTYNGMEILYVPSSRFKTIIELNSGENDQWGFKPGTDAQDINFMLLYPQSLVQAAKTAKGKFFSADENPNLDSHTFAFRIFHDAYVVDKLKDGVCVNIKPVTP